MPDQQPDALSRRAVLGLAAAAAVPPISSRVPGLALLGSNVSPEAGHSAKTVHDLAKLPWKLYGFQPYTWHASWSPQEDISHCGQTEIRGGVDAPVPGSVQMALLRAGVIKDWNVALNSRECEWVENRDWIYQTALPDEWVREAGQIRLVCEGLDYAGAVLLNGKSVDSFQGSFTPHSFDLKPHLKPSGNLLQILFTPPPRWLGSYGYASHVTDWKPRYYYYWDWTNRMVQSGIWDRIELQTVPASEIEKLLCYSDADVASGKGILHVSGAVSGNARLQLRLTQGTRVIHHEVVDARRFAEGIQWSGLPVELWWPNGMGGQPLYDLTCELVDEHGRALDRQARRVGFRHIEWRTTRNAAAGADPFLCVVNGKEVFLFGVNWTPIRTNFADVKDEDYNKRLNLYRDCGMNVMRVWGGAFLEKESFYNGCDERGILVWQEFPLCGSTEDCIPPTDPASIDAMAAIAASYIDRRQHHASLLLWCGGNELSERTPLANAVTIKNPMLARLGEVVASKDPLRRFYPTAPYGPVLGFTADHIGKGVLWDTHGPYDLTGPVDGEWKQVLTKDDAMFHSEMGAPSASSADLIRRYKGNLKETPGTRDNPLWNRQSGWLEWPKFVKEKGREPRTLEEYVAWSQARQSAALVLAAQILKGRFPSCGGLILWMGHDAFPCCGNTSIVDFDGNPKPAALALAKIFRS